MTTVDQLLVNDMPRRLRAEGERTLLSVLRDDLELTGCKYGCGEGKCGACTVLLEGKAVRSCITPVSAVEGRPITTIEGLEKDGRLHPLQQAFLEADALQCGYCTPGMILASLSLLRQNSDPSRQDIVKALDGNLCRCGTYSRIVLAVQKAAQALKGGVR